MTKEEKRVLFQNFLNNIKQIIEDKSPSGIRNEVCKRLKQNISYYDWVGFYLSDGDENLILHEFEGEPTIHTKIRFGEGICGLAAVNKETFLVSDVTKEINYLSCSIKVKSEIVVPIMREGNFIGELDIDSHTLCAFDETDREFLEELCSLIAEHL
ncbi:MAG: GAF domain-containing protein [Myxococcota bacterium]